MKNLYLLLLLPLGLAAQNGFEAKKKPKAAATQQAVTQTIIDGEKSDNKFRLTANDLIALNQRNRVVKDENGRVVFIEKPAKKNLNRQARKGVLSESFSFLEEIKADLNVKTPSQEFELTEQQSDENGQTHLRFKQTYQHLTVYGSEIMLHEADDQIRLMNGRSFKTPEIASTSPDFDAQMAKNIAFADVKLKSIIQQNPLAKSILKAQDEASELVIYHDKTQTEHLAWALVIRPNILERWQYFIDAHSGKIIDKVNNTCSLDGTIRATSADLNGVTQAFSAYQSGSQYILMDTDRPMFNKTKSVLPDEPIGAIWTINANGSSSGNDMNIEQITSTNPNNWNKTGVSAHINAGLAYDYYRVKHSRNSLNARGGNIISVININDENGKGMDNAYWNGQFMGYGNGRTAFLPLAGSLDVAGHEMTHGVVENSAKLEYRSQSGAINESIADIFGVLIENVNLKAGQEINWTLGESVVKASAFPSGALRSLKNPNQGGTRDPGYQPKTMSQYVNLEETQEEDNGGVHVNSGIPNYAFYLYASNANVGLETAGKVYYKALTQYLTRQSQFLDLRLAVIQAAKDVAPNTESAARAAFDAVGITDGTTTGGGGTPPTTPTQPKPDIPANPGSEFILVFEPSTKQLYTGDASTSNFVSVSSKGMRSKPSVTDDGSAVYFVGNDKNIYAIANPSLSTRRESQLTQNGLWDNVAVSKDGKRLAALKFVEEKLIHVVDLTATSPIFKPFKLYNPTYSGVQTGEIAYADSFEWDFTGEKIVYDAFNFLKNPTGKSIDYWDVGVIKVWDKAKNTFAEGTIEKIFSNLDEGDNIGNPSFSKTSPDVIVFDYFKATETSANKFKIFGANLYKNTLEEIAVNNDVGYPNYSKDDRRVSFNTLSTAKQQDIAFVQLDASKVKATTTPKTLFTDASLLVWYAVGQRKLPTKVNQTIAAFNIANQKKGAKITLNASASSSLAVQYSITTGDATVANNIVTCGNTAGKVTVKAYQAGNTDYNAATPIEVSFSIEDGTAAVKQNQTISFGVIADQRKGAKITLAATTTANLAIQYTISAGDATLSGATLTCGNTVGKVTVKASQVGDANFNAATPVEISFNVLEDVAAVKQNQTISFTQIADQKKGASVILAVAASSKLAIKIDVVAGDASVADGVLTCGTRAGVVTLRASQAGDASFNAAPTVDMSFRILEPSNLLSVQNESSDLVFYPNPSNDFVQIKEVNGLIVKSLAIISTTGQTLKTADKNTLIDLRDLPSGMYILNAETNKGTFQRKIIRE